MNQQRSFLDDLKHQYRYGGATLRLIYINVAVFLLIHLGLVIGRLSGNEPSVALYIGKIFALDAKFGDFIYHPWGIITSIFAHFSFLHLAFNMLFLYFSGRIFEQLFDQKRLIYTYILGGIAGSIFEILANSLLPAFELSSSVIVGASGSIMAIFFAIAFHQPKMTVNLFGVFPVRIIILAGLFLLTDFLNLGINDGTAHFAHIGGAILGIISVQNLYSSSNLVNAMQRLGDSFIKFISKGSPRKRMKVVTKNNTRNQTDAEYNQQKKNKQAEIDRILDKISKSGYDSLTRQEKDFLFNQSKNG